MGRARRRRQSGRRVRIGLAGHLLGIAARATSHPYPSRRPIPAASRRHASAHCRATDTGSRSRTASGRPHSFPVAAPAARRAPPCRRAGRKSAPGRSTAADTAGTVLASGRPVCRTGRSAGVTRRIVSPTAARHDPTATTATAWTQPRRVAHSQASDDGSDARAAGAGNRAGIECHGSDATTPDGDAGSGHRAAGPALATRGGPIATRPDATATRGGPRSRYTARAARPRDQPTATALTDRDEDITGSGRTDTPHHTVAFAPRPGWWSVGRATSRPRAVGASASPTVRSGSCASS